MNSSTRSVNAEPARGSLGIKGQLVLFFSLLFVLVVGATAVVSFSFQRTFVVQETVKRGSLLAKSLAISAREPLLERDLLALGSVVQAIRREPDVAGAWIEDHAGKVVIASDAESPGLRMQGRTTLLVSEQSDRMAFVEPIVYAARTIGSAHIGLDLAHVNQAVAATRRRVVGTMLAALLLGMSGTFLLTRMFVRPLESLVAATREAAMGNLRVNVEIRRRDEIGVLTDAFNQMIADLRRASEKIQRGYLDTTRALAAAIEAKDTYTRGHCQRVCAYAIAVGERLALPETTMRDLELAAILHDIGKIGIDDAILTKPGRLTFEQMRVMHRHPVIGERILQSVEMLRPIASHIVHHHEHYDGNGYPHGAKGDGISLIGRILALVDAYDSMTSTRPYRTALSDEESLRRLRAKAGTQFDPRLVATFLDLHKDGVIDRIRTADAAAIAAPRYADAA